MLDYSKEYWDDIAKTAYAIRNTDKLSGKSVLVTGATGMICSTVADILWYLRKNVFPDIKIILAGRSEEKIRSRFSYAAEGDFDYFEFNTAAVDNTSDGYDYIIHGAGNADPAAIMKEPVETILTNVSGLRSLFSLLKNTDSRLLFISSSEVYGRNLGDHPIKEDDYGYVDILNPRACYPNAKRISETLCAAFKEEYGKDSVIVRPGHVFGPSVSDKDSRASAEFTRRVHAGDDIILKSSGEKIRSYVYTLDCASAIITVLLNGESLNAYNISNPDTTASIKEFAMQMAKESGVSVRFELRDGETARSGNLMDNSSVDPGKLMSLGWEPLFDLETGIRATLKHYVKESGL